MLSFDLSEVWFSKSVTVPQDFLGIGMKQLGEPLKKRVWIFLFYGKMLIPSIFHKAVCIIITMSDVVAYH